jgi:hypothetical protein
MSSQRNPAARGFEWLLTEAVANYATTDTTGTMPDGNGTGLLMPAGETKYNVYLISNSVQNVTARMDDLFRMGVR